MDGKPCVPSRRFGLQALPPSLVTICDSPEKPIIWADKANCKYDALASTRLLLFVVFEGRSFDGAAGCMQLCEVEDNSSFNAT